MDGRYFTSTRKSPSEARPGAGDTRKSGEKSSRPKRSGSASWRYGFFFSSRRRHTRSYGDWSSDVCSSDLIAIRDSSGELHLVRGETGWSVRERSEERRVGKEGRSGRWPDQHKKNAPERRVKMRRISCSWSSMCERKIRRSLSVGIANVRSA